MEFYNNCRLGKNKNVEIHFNSHSLKEYTIKRELKKLHRGWGKHRIEDEPHTIYCTRLKRIVTYSKGKPKEDK